MRLAFQSASSPLGYIVSVPMWNPRLLPSSLGSLAADPTFQGQDAGPDPGAMLPDAETMGFAESIMGGSISGATMGYQAAQMLGSSHEWKNIAVGGIAGGLALAGTIAASTVVGAAIAPFLFAAAGLVGPIAAMFKGCGTTCTQASQIADKAEVALNSVKNKYLSLPVHYATAQRAALVAFDAIMADMYKACSNPALREAGQKCISERLIRGGSAPWCPAGTGCDWLTAIRDPIANDPDVAPDPPRDRASTDSTMESFAGSNGAGGLMQSTVGGFPIPLLLGGGLLVYLALQN